MFRTEWKINLSKSITYARRDACSGLFAGIVRGERKAARTEIGRARLGEIRTHVAAQFVAGAGARPRVVGLQASVGLDSHRLIADRARSAFDGEDVVAARLQRCRRPRIRNVLRESLGQLAVVNPG